MPKGKKKKQPTQIGPRLRVKAKKIRNAVYENPLAERDPAGGVCDVVKRGKPCPTEFTYRDGRPYLRLCFEAGSEGYLIDARDPVEANKKALSFCACVAEKSDPHGCSPSGSLGSTKAKRSKRKRRR